MLLSSFGIASELFPGAVHQNDENNKRVSSHAHRFDQICPGGLFIVRTHFTATYLYIKAPPLISNILAQWQKYIQINVYTTCATPRLVEVI